MSELRAGIVFVDVDDTLVRSAGAKRIPIASVAQRVAALQHAGATLHCWSTGGAEYAREVARELGLEHCFIAFLPKPTISSTIKLRLNGAFAAMFTPSTSTPLKRDEAGRSGADAKAGPDPGRPQRRRQDNVRTRISAR